MPAGHIHLPVLAVPYSATITGCDTSRTLNQELNVGAELSLDPGWQLREVSSGQRLKLHHRQLVDSAIAKLPGGTEKAEWPARLAIQGTEQCLIVELSMMVYDHNA